MTTKRTDQLRPGDRLLVDGRLVRTVQAVAPNGYVNSRNRPLYDVTYVEGHTDEWSGGNSGAAETEWTVAPPAHLMPTACHVCGHGSHADTTDRGGHRYWSNADAAREFARQPQGVLPERPEGYYHVRPEGE